MHGQLIKIPEVEPGMCISIPETTCNECSSILTSHKNSDLRRLTSQFLEWSSSAWVPKNNVTQEFRYCVFTYKMFTDTENQFIMWSRVIVLSLQNVIAYWRYIKFLPSHEWIIVHNNVICKINYSRWDCKNIFVKRNHITRSFNSFKIIHFTQEICFSHRNFENGIQCTEYGKWSEGHCFKRLWGRSLWVTYGRLTSPLR